MMKDSSIQQTESTQWRYLLPILEAPVIFEDLVSSMLARLGTEPLAPWSE